MVKVRDEGKQSGSLGQTSDAFLQSHQHIVWAEWVLKIDSTRSEQSFEMTKCRDGKNGGDELHVITHQQQQSISHNPDYCARE